jgi:UDP-2,4-diacetamido-2,4,6-trideoxy-beta-L-altropyranose hydrolase
MNVVFRVDSSSQIGLGHLMRCLVLAEQYKKDNIVFSVQDLEGNANQKIIDKGHKIVILRDNFIGELVQSINELNADMVIFDNYDIDSKFEKEIKEKTGVKILSLDDTYEKHHCDILLNHNIYAEADKYKGLVPEFCVIRCGSEHTLIRDEFKEIKIQSRPINKNNPVVFVSLGGSDPYNIGLIVLEVLSGFENITINFATTSSNKSISKLQGLSKKYQNINICVDCNITKLMNNSDYAIITPSVIVHEALALQIPFISIMTADNQRFMHTYLCENNYDALKKNEISKLKSRVKKYNSV